MSPHHHHHHHPHPIHSLGRQGLGIDLIIISTSSHYLSNFWTQKLQTQRGTLFKSSALIFCPVESFPHGAGNGLGTLDALKQTNLYLQTHHQTTLKEFLTQNRSCALYHTAGKGTRLAPMSLTEHNNKSAILLPAIDPLHTQHTPLSILELVIKQTQSFHQYLNNRIGVFWSDQIFSPPHIHPPKTPIELLAISIPYPTKQTYQQQNLPSYGLTTTSHKLLSKASYQTFQSFQHLGFPQGTGINLGSFSITPSLIEILWQIFAHELHTQQGHYNTDPDFWMPITLNHKDYQTLFPHKTHLIEKLQHLQHAFSIQHLHPSTNWWDFGTNMNYYTQLQKLCHNSTESQQLKQLFGITHSHQQHSNILINSTLTHSDTQHSILVNTHTQHTTIQNSILIHSTLTHSHTQHAILYKTQSHQQNIHQLIQVQLPPLTFQAPLQQDPSTHWHSKLHNNPSSFAQQFEHTQKKHRLGMGTAPPSPRNRGEGSALSSVTLPPPAENQRS